MSGLRIIHSPEELGEFDESLHLALGVFDGVHLGHQTVIAGVVGAAKKSSGKAGVVTFSPHPIQLLAPTKAPKRILASLEHKAAIMKEEGVDFLLVLNFTHELASLEPEEFMEKLLRNGNIKTISVGEDWLFGKARRGNAKLLSGMSEQQGFDLVAVPPVMYKGDRVSSTRIRQAILDGNILAASEMLGRPYTVFGEVVKGRMLGRTIGFPTANVVVQNEQLPPSGVWAVKACIDDEWVKGIANLGVRPTVEDANTQRLLEVFLFDFDQDLYGKIIETRFEYFVRPEKKFESIEALTTQIQKDVASVKGGS